MRVIAAITMLLSCFLESQAVELRLRSSLINGEISPKERKLLNDSDNLFDMEVTAAAIMMAESPDDFGMLALAEEQHRFLLTNPNIVTAVELASGEASSYFQSIGFPGIEHVSPENRIELDAFFAHEVAALGCGNYFCEIPVAVSLYVIVNVGAVLTQALVIAISKALLIPTGGSIYAITAMLMIIIILGQKAGNFLVPTIVHEACCNLNAYM
jgi:hypothetical protein